MARKTLSGPATPVDIVKGDISVNTGDITIDDVTIADGGDATQGATTDAAVTTNASGTISGKLRGVVVHLVTALANWTTLLGRLPAALTASGNLKVSVEEGGAGGGAVTVADGADVNAGTTTDAAVTTDANGTLSAKVRGLVTLFGTLLGRLPAALTASGNLKVSVEEGGAGGGAVTVADGADVNAGTTTDAAVTTDASGTVSGKLRGLVTLFATLLGRLPAALTASGNLKVSVEEGGAGGGAVTVADGADVAEGTTTDAAASSAVAEDATARTGISLWKGIKNVLLLINAKFGDLGQTNMAGSAPVVIASDQSALSVDATGAGDVPVTLDGEAVALAAGDNNIGNVDIASAIPAGTNAIGKLAANSGVDIGDVDVTSVVPGTGATNLGKAHDAAFAANDVGVPLLAVRDDDMSGLGAADGDYTPITVCENGAVHVAGPAVGQASASYTCPLFNIGAVVLDSRPGADVIADNTEWGALQMTQYGELRTRDDDANTDLDTIAGAVDGNEMQVDVVASLPAGTNAIGKLAANDGVDIGDVDVTSLPATPAGTNLIGRVSASDETSTIYNATTALTPKFAVIDDATSGDNSIVAAVSGKKIRVLNLVCIAAGEVDIRFESGAGGDALTGQMSLNEFTGFAPGYCPVGHFETDAGDALNLELSDAVSVDGWLTYVEV